MEMSVPGVKRFDNKSIKYTADRIEVTYKTIPENIKIIFRPDSEIEFVCPEEWKAGVREMWENAGGSQTLVPIRLD